jgi:hypothetical protein
MLDRIEAFGRIAFAIFIFFLILKTVVEPLAPLVTILFVLGGTIASFRHSLTGIMSIGGLALYLASWPAVATYGTWPGMLVWMIGVILWFAALGLPAGMLPQRASIKIT